MKAKTSAAFFVALLFFATQLSLRAQTPDCYVIQCPSKVLAPCEGVYGAHAWFSVTVSNLCPAAPSPTVIYSVPPGSVFPPGTNVVCAFIQIPGLPAQQCCFEVIVDGCCPTNCLDLICPSNVVLACQTAAGAPGAFVDLPKPQVTNHCGDHLLPATLQVRCTPQASAAGGAVFFPPGTNTVVCCITDGTTTAPLKCCCFQVIVAGCPPITDQCQPQILCPRETQVSCTGPDGAIVFFPPPQVLDPCGLAVATNCTHVSGTFFPNGKTTVACCVTWKNPTTGLLATECCCFDVVVRCCPPTNCVTRLICPTNLVLECPGITPNYPVFGSNNCEPTKLVCDPPPGTAISGSITVCCKLLNSSGIVLTQCCFNVTVVDTTPPVLNCPQDITVVSPDCQPVAVQLPIVTATDNCDPNPMVKCTALSTALFPCGTTTITCTAVDASGNTTNCSFNVIVICRPGEIVCPPDMLFTCVSPTGVVVNYSVTVTNGCPPVTAIVCVPPSGSVFLPGSYVVCCTNSPSPIGTAGNICCFKVRVVPDDIPPSIVCPTNILVLTPNCAPIGVKYPLPDAADNCQLDSVICLPPPGSIFPLGTTTVICCATDKAGNSNCCSFTVTVRCPDCNRTICPSNIVVECAGPNGTVVTYKAYGTNVCTGVELPVICAPPSGSVFPPGLTLVCCTNAPSAVGGTAGVCCFTVEVRPDTTPPSIACPTNIAAISPNCAAIEVFYAAPSASDNCQLDSVACTPPSGSLFPLGTTVVTCCAVDKAGNSNCCSFKVTVRCPTDCIRLVCPSNIVTECAGPNGAYVKFEAYITNVCTGGIFPIVCSVPAGSIFPLGTTTVSCSNAPTGILPLWCCFDVTVKPDLLPPVINCPSNIDILCARPIGARVEYVVTASDNCDPAPTLTCVPPSGSLFPLGCTNVTCTATDHAGNTSTCSFRVCVIRQGCYLRNPSFEILVANLPLALNCGDPIAFAAGWTALAGTPDLFRPPFASLVPGNCRGVENPCQGSNYAGLEGGYTTSGGFVTEEMMGTLIAPLNNGQRFRLRSCLSLAEISTAPVLVEFVLANSANLAQQQVIHQVLVVQKKGWMQYQPPCFLVPRTGHWDRLIIRASQAGPNQQRYPVGYVYVDNVNICCCKPELGTVVFDGNNVNVTWDGAGQLQGCSSLGDPTVWRDITSPVEMDPDTGLYHTTFPRPEMGLFFRVVGPDNTTECTECGAGG